MDISEAFRGRLETFLAERGTDPAELRPLREIVPVEEADRARLFGESLTPGLLLARG